MADRTSPKVIRTSWEVIRTSWEVIFMMRGTTASVSIDLGRNLKVPRRPMPQLAATSFDVTILARIMHESHRNNHIFALRKMFVLAVA